MINHARTLLLNRRASDNHITTDTAAEFVPAEFFPVNFTNELRLVRRVLFGSNPDQRFINLRIRELMGYVHQTEFAHYVYDLDPRVTYWPGQADNFKDAARSEVIITQLFGEPQKLNIVGAFQPNHSVGKSMRSYTVTVGTRALPMRAMRLEAPGGSDLVATIQQLGTTDPPELYSVGNSDAATTAVLPQTDLKMLLNFGEPESEYAALQTESDCDLLYEAYAASGRIESEQLSALMPLLSDTLATILAQWFVVAKAVPQPIITTLMPTLELLGEPVFLSLFGVTDEEPYATFKNLWFDHYAPAYRLAGLVLAMIYRTEELRVNKHGG